MPLKGRLGLESARVPHADRHGLMWLERGRLAVEDGNVVFTTAGSPHLDSGAYDIPFQQISCLLMGPGSVVSHDALRLLARHGTGLLAVGSGGVRLYAESMPRGPDRSTLAREQARLWADEEASVAVARKMYAVRLGELLPQRDLNALRGIEGKRVKEVYRRLADEYGVEWEGRRYDRDDPEETDRINQAINHAATAVYAAAGIAVASVGAIPQLGFIHESSGRAFSLDIADLHRDDVTLPVAFEATSRCQDRDDREIESQTRRLAGRRLRDEDVIPQMIDDIKAVLDVDDGGGDA
ncbi:MAG: type I-E CRISPR-associated endonuclease Cas1e [Bradymonadaceae bacterium]